MNHKFHINAFRGLMVFLLVVSLNACAAKPKEEIVPITQPTAAIGATVTPSPLPPSSSPGPDSTDPQAVDVPVYFSLGAKPDVPPQTINGVTATINQAYIDESHVLVKYTISGLDWPDYVQMDPTLMASLS